MAVNSQEKERKKERRLWVSQTFWDCPFQDSVAAMVITFYWISYSSPWIEILSWVSAKENWISSRHICTTLNKIIIDEREGETFLCPLLALHEMDGNLTDAQRWPIPWSDSLPMSVVAEREGRLAHYDLLDLHKPGMSLDLKKIWANFYLLIWPAANGHHTEGDTNKEDFCFLFSFLFFF